VNPGYITSIINIDKNFIAVSNSNKTIHIFDLNSLNKLNINNLVTNLFGKNLLYSCCKIRFNNLISQIGEEQFFIKDFKAKGAILYNKNNSFDFTILGYNGYVYNIKYIPLHNKYEVTQKTNFAEIIFDDEKNVIINDNTFNYLGITEKQNNIIDDDNNQWKII
jgi:hypothetical protein